MEAQTAEWIETRARSLGMELEARVEAEEAEAESFVPWSAVLTGTWTEAQREALSAILAAELEIPSERQRWVGG